MKAIQGVANRKSCRDIKIPRYFFFRLPFGSSSWKANDDDDESQVSQVGGNLKPT